MKELWLSHPEELAKLAAAVSQGKSPAEAVPYALKLCHESVKALRRAAIESGGVDDYSSISLDGILEKIATIHRASWTAKTSKQWSAQSNYGVRTRGRFWRRSADGLTLSPSRARAR